MFSRRIISVLLITLILCVNVSYVSSSFGSEESDIYGYEEDISEENKTESSDVDGISVDKDTSVSYPMVDDLDSSENIFKTRYVEFNNLIDENRADYFNIKKDNNRLPDDVKLVNDLPDSKDLSRSPYFPEVKSQGSQDSCCAWAVTYYSYGFLEAKDNGWDEASEGNPKHLLSPAWTFNRVNNIGYGSTFTENARVLKEWGCATLNNLTYNESDDSAWGNESAFRDSVKHRIKSYHYLNYEENGTVEDIKQLISSEIPVTFLINSGQFDDGFEDGNYVISSKEYDSYATNHRNTIVGYNESITDDGEKGAFKVVNSEGKSFGDEGFYWITYDAFREIGRLHNIQYLLDEEDYSPSLIAKIELGEQPPRMGNISLSIIDDMGNKNTKQFFYDPDPNFENRFPSFMYLDVTEFSDRWEEGSNAETFELEIGSGSGEVSSFKIEYYKNDYFPDQPDYVSKESEDTPASTPGEISVRFYGPSHIVTTEPKPRSKEVSYIERVNVTFTDSMDTGFTPKINQITGDDPGGWSFEGWYSVNKANDTASWSHNAWGVAENVTLRVSGYVNDSGYMGSPYQWYFKTDTYEPIEINSSSEFAAYADENGWPGDGSEEDPWVIQGIEIDGEFSDFCVSISGVEDYFIIRNSTFHNARFGISLNGSSNGVIRNNTITKVGRGISLSGSDSFEVVNNKIVISRIVKHMSGMFLMNSTDNEFRYNNITYGTTSKKLSEGFRLRNSDDNRILNNEITHFYNSLSIYESRGCYIEDNDILSKQSGAILFSCLKLKIINNKFSENGIILRGEKKDHYLSHIIESNTIRGKPILYYKNRSDLDIDDDVGELILTNCSDISIRDRYFDKKPGIMIHESENISINNCSFDNELYETFSGIFADNSKNISVLDCLFNEANIYFINVSASIIDNNVLSEDIEKELDYYESRFSYGVLLFENDNVLVKNNNIAERRYGVFLNNSFNCKIFQNIISYSSEIGILFLASGENDIYHNNLIENNVDAAVYSYYYYQTVPENSWDNGYPSGGNYWSKLDHEDKNDDGIADSSFKINDNNIDRYPLVKPFRKEQKVELPEDVLSIDPEPKSYDVSVDKDVKIVFNGSLNTSDVPVIEGEDGPVDWGFLGFSDTNRENDTVIWTHDDWEMGERLTINISSYSFIDKGSNDYFTFSFTTYEKQPPTIRDLSSTEAEMGEMFTFLVEIEDNAAVEEAEVEFWYDDGKRTLPLFNVYEDIYKIKTKISYNETEFHYILRAKDTSGNVHVTDEKYFTLIDDISPVVHMNEIEVVEVFNNVTFNASDSKDNIGIKNYFWDIDGREFSGKKINISFSQIGRIRVTLVVVDPSGNSASVTKIITVDDFINPVADAGEDRTVPIGQEVKLDASNSSDNYGIKDYIWEFDDKKFRGKTINYTFSAFKTFNITLRVVDETGNVDETTVNYTVKDLMDPTADAGEDITGTVGKSVILNGTLSEDDFSIKDHFWSIEGRTYNREILEYTFDEPGKYNVSLRVVDWSGNEDIDYLNVEIKKGLVTVGPIEDQDGNVLNGVKITLIKDGSEIGTNKTDKDGLTTFKVDFNPENEDFKVRIKGTDLDETLETSFEGANSGTIDVERRNENIYLWIVGAVAAIGLILLWYYRRN